MVTKKRNRLTGNSVRMIMCLKDWGIITDEDVVDDNDDEDNDNDDGTGRPEGNKQ